MHEEVSNRINKLKDVHWVAKVNDRFKGLTIGQINDLAGIFII